MSRQSRTTRVLVGVYEGGFTGIDTYAEQVALAGAAAGHEMTLLTTTPALAQDLRLRLAPTGIRVLDLGLSPQTPAQKMSARLWPGLALDRVERAFVPALIRLQETFPVAHLNHPRLARAARASARRVCVGAWFYPHALLGRVVATWHHTGGRLPRSLVLAGKAVSYYRNDALGFRYSDCVLAPTDLLTRQLRDRGIPAVTCPPPARILADAGRQSPAGHDPPAQPGAASAVRLVICSGDLSHPRKNVRAAVQAVRLLHTRDRPVRLDLIGRNGTALQRDVAQLPRGVRVSFTGPLPAAEVHARMRLADALLFPSLYEEWGYVAVESLLCGTPVVTFPVYPFGDMLAPGFGVCARDMTVRAFAEAVRDVLAKGRSPSLAASAAERFGSAAIGSRLSEIWLPS